MNKKKKTVLKRNKSRRPVKRFERKSRMPIVGMDVTDVYPVDKERTESLKELTNDVKVFMYSVVTKDEDGNDELTVLSFNIDHRTKFYIHKKEAIVVQLKPDAELLNQKFSADDIRKMVIERNGNYEVESDGTINVNEPGIITRTKRPLKTKGHNKRRTKR